MGGVNAKGLFKTRKYKMSEIRTLFNWPMVATPEMDVDENTIAIFPNLVLTPAGDLDDYSIEMHFHFPKEKYNQDRIVEIKYFAKLKDAETKKLAVLNAAFRYPTKNVRFDVPACITFFEPFVEEVKTFVNSLAFSTYTMEAIQPLNVIAEFNPKKFNEKSVFTIAIDFVAASKSPTHDGLITISEKGGWQGTIDSAKIRPDPPGYERDIGDVRIDSTRLMTEFNSIIDRTRIQLQNRK